MLIDKYGGLIKGIIRRHLSNLIYYEDECINDVLLSIWNNINSFSGKGSFKSWIGAIAKFKAIDYKRKYLKLNTIEDIDNLAIRSDYLVENELLKKELKEEIHSMLDLLNDKDKDIFIKHYLEDKKVLIVSNEMNLDITIIYSRLSRGRKKLQSIFKSI